MSFSRTIARDKIASGHVMFVKEIKFSEMPLYIEGAQHYEKFYVVKNFDDNGVVFMYLAKGYVDPVTSDKAGYTQIVVWYPKSGRMWSSFGLTFEDAINGAQRDGWLYA